MAQGMHQSLRLTQSLILAPQLQQSLALLQAPMLELKALVEHEMQQNPVLEEVSATEIELQEKEDRTGEKPVDDTDPTEPPRDVTFDPATEKPTSAAVDDFQAEFERLARLDQEWREHFAQTNIPSRASEEEEERRQFMFDSLTTGTSLQEDLLEQMRLSAIPESEKLIAEEVIGNIDDAGYLKASADEIASLLFTGDDMETQKAEAETTPGESAEALLLLRRLKQPADTLSVYLGRRLVPEINGLLSGPKASLAEHQTRLAGALNNILTLGEFYNAEAFAGIALRSETSALLTRHPTGRELVRLHRLLLEDAFPMELRKKRIVLIPDVTPERVTKVIRAVQTFDPPGVGARDLRECLLLQLERAGQQESAEYRIVSDYMEALSKRRIPEIARGVGLGLDAVQETLKRIAQLEPRPGREFVRGNDQYILPEVFVEKTGPDFAVTTNNEQIPRLRISNTYKDLMSRSAVDVATLQSSFKSGDDSLKQDVDKVVAALKTNDDPQALVVLRNLAGQPDLSRDQSQALQIAIAQVMERKAFIEARDYIREKIRAGKFLIKSIDQRQQTILNIAREIVKRQSEFMEKGVAALKPLTMAQVAEVVGVHETTVSRAVAGKYMQTPRGLFEMKYFFTAGIQTTSGGGMSNTSVKDLIAGIFEKEASNKPLSDQEVVKMLKDKGIVIARRTVAKYRTELNILPSNLRKVY